MKRKKKEENCSTCGKFLKLCRCEKAAVKLRPSGEDKDPAHLTTALIHWKRKRKEEGFDLARLSKVKFGIVDKEWACFLALSFQLDMIAFQDGGTWTFLPEQESLKLLTKHGSAENMEGLLAWVWIDDAGRVHFIELLEEG